MKRLRIRNSIPLYAAWLCMLVACYRGTELDLSELPDRESDPEKSYNVYLTDGTKYVAARWRIEDSILIIEKLKSDMLDVTTPMEFRLSDVEKIEALTLKENATGLALVGTAVVVAVVVILATWKIEFD